MSASRLSGITATVIVVLPAALFLAWPTPSAAHGNSAPTVSTTAPAPSSAAQPTVTYLPPDMSIVGPAELRRYYRWRHKMDWTLAPIHTRADLKQYLKATAKSDSPLDALSPGARERFLSSLVFHEHGLGGFSAADLQYLSSVQIYKILGLFGAQGYTLRVTGGNFQASRLTGAGSNKPSLVERRFNKYMDYLDSSLDMSARRRSQAAGHEYEMLFSPLTENGNLRKLSSADLRLLLRAAKIASQGGKAKYTADVRTAFEAMQKRHAVQPPDYQLVYQAFVGAGQFNAARKFVLEYPNAGLMPFPAYRDEAKNAGKNTPTVVVVSTTKRELVHQHVNLEKPAQVLILADPQCHFCRKFEVALKGHPKLRAVLEQHALRVTPPGSELEFDTLQRWNRIHPKAPLNIMYGLEGWPMIKALAVPQFFFLRHGKVMKHISGWGHSTLSVIESDLKSIGLWQ